MAMTLEELVRRLIALEEEVASLRARVTSPCPAAIPAPIDSTTNDVHQETDLSEEAPGIEKLRAMLAAHGIHPGNEIVRQAIAAMGEQEEDP